MNTHRWAKPLLFLGDIAFLYVALWLTLMLRYGSLAQGLWELHLIPFTIIFGVLLLSFFIAGLYDLRIIAPVLRHSTLFFLTFLVGGGVAVFLFYLIPAWRITPRLNLLIHLSASSLLLFGWHWFFSWALVRKTKIKVWYGGRATAEQKELTDVLADHPQFGYERVESPKEADIIVTLSDLYRNDALQKEFFQLLLCARFIAFPAFYERITGKVPVSLISEVWFLENIAGQEKQLFEAIKRCLDILFVLALGAISIILFPFLAFLIKSETRGPIFITQTRMGKGGRLFTLVKFRSMVASGSGGLAEKNGAQWSSPYDKRITRIGAFLRATRLDELPQLWNVLKGEMSFVGPRPERPEFVAVLKERLPFYDIRHIVRPGLSGWAQINFPYGASVEDALEKLRYDLYYVKHRSFLLDLIIALKTLKVLISGAGR